jgi:hypothetical protein
MIGYSFSAIKASAQTNSELKGVCKNFSYVRLDYFAGTGASHILANFKDCVTMYMYVLRWWFCLVK